MPRLTRAQAAELERRAKAAKNVKEATLENGIVEMCIDDSDDEPVKNVSTASRKRRHNDAFDADDEACDLIDSADDMPLPVKKTKPKAKAKTKAKAKAKQRISKPRTLAASSLQSIPEVEPLPSAAEALPSMSDSLPIHKDAEPAQAGANVVDIVSSGSEGDDESQTKTKSGDEVMQGEESEGDSDEEEDDSDDSDEDESGSTESEWSNSQGDKRMTDADVEEKFPQENFRVLSEMRILGKIKVAILDFVG